MKKIILILLLSTILLSSDLSLATKIYISIAKALSSNVNPKFYLHGSVRYLSNNIHINEVSSCEAADIIVVNSLKGLSKSCKKGILFSTSYKVFLKNEEIIGSFFWQKGRPNIVFRRSRLEDMNIHLNSSFDKYIE